jgi:hypothetical protein
MDEVSGSHHEKFQLQRSRMPKHSTSCRFAASEHTESGTCHFANMLWAPLESCQAATCEG